MANIKFGEFVTSAIGKVGGSVMKTNISGAVVQNFGNNKGYGRGKQQSNKFELALLSRMWGGLTDDQRLSWAAAPPYFPKLNKVGVEFFPSPYNCFIEVNYNRHVLEESYLTDFVAPILPTPAIIWNIDSFVNVNPIIRLSYEMTGDFTGFKILGTFSGPWSVGTTSPKNVWRRCRLITTLDTNPMNYGFCIRNNRGTLISGQKYFFRFYPIEIASGKRHIFAACSGVCS